MKKFVCSLLILVLTLGSCLYVLAEDVVNTWALDPSNPSNATGYFREVIHTDYYTDGYVVTSTYYVWKYGYDSSGSFSAYSNSWSSSTTYYYTPPSEESTPATCSNCGTEWYVAENGLCTNCTN